MRATGSSRGEPGSAVGKTAKRGRQSVIGLPAPLAVRLSCQTGHVNGALAGGLTFGIGLNPRRPG